MANNCSNILTISGPAEARRSLRNAAVADDGSSLSPSPASSPPPQVTMSTASEKAN